MAHPYLKQLQDLVGTVKSGDVELVCKHFFSGAAAYVDGRIFMTFTAAGLALKLPEDDRNALFEQGATPLRYFPNAPVKKDYVLLPAGFIQDDRGLNDWISRSIEFVR